MRRLSVVIMFVLAVPAASAQAKPRPRVVALDFDGPGAKSLRLRTIRSMRRVRWVPLAKARATASQLGVSLQDDAGRLAVARKLRVSAYLSGGVTRKGRRWRAVIRVTRTVGSKSTRFVGSSRRRYRAVRTAGYRLYRVSRRLLRGAVAPEPAVATPAPVKRPVPKRVVRDDAPTPDARPVVARRARPTLPSVLDATSGLPRWEISAAGLALSRTLTYTDDVMDSLRTFKLPSGPAAKLAVEWYPYANLGLETRVQRSFGIEASNADGTRFASATLEYVLGSRARATIGGVELGVCGGIGAHSFSIDGDDTMSSGIPDTNYTFVRGGIDAKFNVRPKLRVTLGGAYRHLLGTGELESSEWFPRLTGAGIDGRVALGYRLSRKLDVAVAASLRRYFFSMNPEPGDAQIAGGAVDQLISVSIGLVWRLEDVR